jgi:hypothetical protein
MLSSHVIVPCFHLKGQCHEMVFQLRPLVYSLGRNNTPRISFKLVKSRIENILLSKQGASRCKMEGTGFYCFAILRGQIRLRGTLVRPLRKYRIREIAE